MQKHGADLADRPQAVSAQMISNNLRLLTMSAGERMKRLRRWLRILLILASLTTICLIHRVLHIQLQPSAAKRYQPLQFGNAKNYLLDILRDPEHHVKHARRYALLCPYLHCYQQTLYRYAASVIMSVTYGKTTPTQYTDPEVVAIQENVQRFVKTLPIGKGWVDRFPFLQNLPIPEVLRLRRYHKEELALYNSQLDTVRRRIVSSTVINSLTTL